MPHYGYSEIADNVFAKVFIKFSWLLIMANQQPFIDPIANDEVDDGNWVQNWATGRVHPCHPHRCKHPAKDIGLPHVLASIEQLDILIQNLLCIYSIFSFLEFFASSVHDSGDLSHSPKWKFWKMRYERTQSHCEAELGAYYSIPFRWEISVLTLKKTKKVQYWDVKVEL